MIKVFHEMPLALLESGFEEQVTDGSYALVHLFDEHPRYFEHFVKCLKKGRDVILDNSIFELGAAFDPERFVYWHGRLVEEAGTAATLTYIAPDVLDDKDGTLASLDRFLSRWPSLPGSLMAVAQGSTEADLDDCFEAITSVKSVTRIGVSFNCEAYEIDGFDSLLREEKLVVWKTGRQSFIKRMNQRRVLSRVPVHLLGASLPDEFLFYMTDDTLFPYIASLDTSNPVVHGLLGFQYEEPYGLKSKKSILLASMIEREVSPHEEEMILYNIKAFRRINKLHSEKEQV